MNGVVNHFAAVGRGAVSKGSLMCVSQQTECRSRCELLLSLTLIFPQMSNKTTLHYFSLLKNIVIFHNNIYLSCNCCCCSADKSCLTFCNPLDCSMPDFPVLHCLLEFAEIHVELVILSNHFTLHCPFLLLPSIFPSIRVFSNESLLMNVSLL